MRTLRSQRRLVAFVIIVALQVALLLTVIFIEEGRQGGVDIVLESLPVDPRDPVRGDYVILSYRAERLDGLDGARPHTGEQVYVIFRQHGRYWEPVLLDTDNLRAEGWNDGLVAIRARVVNDSPLRVEYPNLGEYFVAQGTGVLPSPPDVHVVVSRDGAARIKHLEVNGERWPPD